MTRHLDRTLHLTRFEDSERPVSIQIFGSDPVRMAASAGMVQEMGADIVDINLGCPVKKVVKQGGGSNLLRDLPLLERIFKAVRRAVTMPLTIKIRTGWDRNSINAVEVLAVWPKTAASRPWRSMAGLVATCSRDALTGR